jgi:hypothetical protein
MKALTVMQPWAQLLIQGATRYETRSWKTKHRGPLLIHAALTFSDAAREMCKMEPFRRLLAEGGIKDPSNLPRRAILGKITMEDCLDMDEALFNHPDPHELELRGYRRGHWAWKVSAPRQLENSIPYRGALGVFEVPDELMILHLPIPRRLASSE